MPVLELDRQADAVFDGGGMKGIAFAGAVQEFEHRGVAEWTNVGGVGFGAIVASLLAAGLDGSELTDVMRQAHFARFSDWHRGRMLRLRRIGRAPVPARGLAKGDFLVAWANHVLGGKTFGDVRRADGTYRLLLLASDVTNRRAVVIPHDLANYSRAPRGRPIDVDEVRVAEGIRMSMSTPVVFDPVRLYEVSSGKEALIVDGTFLSNLPLDLFGAAHASPQRFGFRIQRDAGSSVLATPDLGWSRSSGRALDAYYGLEARELPAAAASSTCVIDIPERLSAADFGQSMATIQTLYLRGREAARKFLDARLGETPPT